ncbi:hypothetical protein CXG81DRAFT_19019 [Caulochytrium protostelioides]|uniref:Uncharacterized protein n=1 Tax=Caulochytrium protostelioides TaxID=1555241 RepID=A0A4P9X7G1_9FUNG|nr:hypothetical protein CXG81DRAFT_19019 [Caulochytrium protostelioides]|eukprot:RKP01152.1 hypothetical protein CXG81DRAFT_19019 [Caulochytrium protostelioides]
MLAARAPPAGLAAPSMAPSMLPAAPTAPTARPSFDLDLSYGRNAPSGPARRLASLLATAPADAARLTRLFLANNHLTVLPSEIAHFGGLVALDLSFNIAPTIPDAVGHGLYATLQTLDARANRLEQLPPSLARATRLTVLLLWKNRLAMPPQPAAGADGADDDGARGDDDNDDNDDGDDDDGTRDVEDRGAASRISSTAGIPWGDRFFRDLTALTVLDLSNNALTRFPHTIFSACRRLTSLHLSHNPLAPDPRDPAQTRLPNALGNLVHLQSLGLRGLGLTALPDALARLTALERLDVRDNALTVLPPAFLDAPLPDLLEVHARGNRLRAAPRWRAAGRLHLLDLRENPLSDETERPTPTSLRLASDMPSLVLLPPGWTPATATAKITVVAATASAAPPAPASPTAAWPPAAAATPAVGSSLPHAPSAFRLPSSPASAVSGSTHAVGLMSRASLLHSTPSPNLLHPRPRAVTSPAPPSPLARSPVTAAAASTAAALGPPQRVGRLPFMALVSGAGIEPPPACPQPQLAFTIVLIPLALADGQAPPADAKLTCVIQRAPHAAPTLARDPVRMALRATERTPTFLAYRVIYDAAQPGDYHVAVSMDGEPLPGSPWVKAIQRPSRSAASLGGHDGAAMGAGGPVDEPAERAAGTTHATMVSEAAPRGMSAESQTPATVATAVPAPTALPALSGKPVWLTLALDPLASVSVVSGSIHLLLLRAEPPRWFHPAAYRVVLDAHGPSGGTALASATPTPTTTMPTPTASVPTASVPTASVPTASVPTASVPTASAPTASAPTASAPTAPASMTPACPPIVIPLVDAGDGDVLLRLDVTGCRVGHYTLRLEAVGAGPADEAVAALVESAVLPITVLDAQTKSPSASAVPEEKRNSTNSGFSSIFRRKGAHKSVSGQPSAASPATHSGTTTPSGGTTFGSGHLLLAGPVTHLTSLVPGANGPAAAQQFLVQKLQHLATAAATAAAAHPLLPDALALAAAPAAAAAVGADGAAATELMALEDSGRDRGERAAAGPAAAARPTLRIPSSYAMASVMVPSSPSTAAPLWEADGLALSAHLPPAPVMVTATATETATMMATAAPAAATADAPPAWALKAVPPATHDLELTRAVVALRGCTVPVPAAIAFTLLRAFVHHGETDRAPPFLRLVLGQIAHVALGHPLPPSAASPAASPAATPAAAAAAAAGAGAGSPTARLPRATTAATPATANEPSSPLSGLVMSPSAPSAREMEDLRLTSGRHPLSRASSRPSQPRAPIPWSFTSASLSLAGDLMTPAAGLDPTKGMLPLRPLPFWFAQTAHLVAWLSIEPELRHLVPDVLVLANRMQGLLLKQLYAKLHSLVAVLPPPPPPSASASASSAWTSAASVTSSSDGHASTAESETPSPLGAAAAHPLVVHLHAVAVMLGEWQVPAWAADQILAAVVSFVAGKRFNQLLLSGPAVTSGLNHGQGLSAGSSPTSPVFVEGPLAAGAVGDAAAAAAPTAAPTATPGADLAWTRGVRIERAALKAWAREACPSSLAPGTAYHQVGAALALLQTGHDLAGGVPSAAAAAASPSASASPAVTLASPALRLAAAERLRHASIGLHALQAQKLIRAVLDARQWRDVLQAAFHSVPAQGLCGAATTPPGGSPVAAAAGGSVHSTSGSSSSQLFSEPEAPRPLVVPEPWSAPEVRHARRALDDCLAVWKHGNPWLTGVPSLHALCESSRGTPPCEAPSRRSTMEPEPSCGMP